MEDAIKEKSRYNEAGLQINRLHNLWLEIQKVRQHGRYDPASWHHYLDAVWSELWAKVNRQQKKKDMIQEHDQLKKFCTIVRSEPLRYELLSKRTLLLREIQDKVGMGGSYEDDTEGAFE